MKKFNSLVMLLVFVLMMTACNGSNNRVDEGGNKVNETLLLKGEEVAKALIDGQYEQIYRQFSEQLKDIVSLKDFEQLGKDFTVNESSFNLESSSVLNGMNTYIWHNETKEKGIVAVLDETLTIQGIQVLFLTSYPETDGLFSEVSYRLPFNEEWYVYWGGHDALSNYHYEYDHIRYAYDFVKVVDGFTYAGDPLKNESYYAFNQDVVAPASGKIVNVINDIEDNVPGQFNEQQPEGNMVVIEHEHGEYSLIAHFKQHSIVVKEGDIVEVGQLLGQTGNSGYSSEAHIHYQVNKDNPEGKSTVIPISFYDGKQWLRGETAIHQ